MQDENSPQEVREVALVQTEKATFEGSGYDAGLSLDTTPTSRVDWAAEPEQRSAYDAKMIADTTPTTRVAPTTPPSNGTDSVSTASSDQ